MNDFQLYYRPREETPGQRITVHSIGIHETMPPQALAYEGVEERWLMMFFHTDAYWNPGTAKERECGKRFIIWPPGAFRSYGSEKNEWNHSWIVLRGNAVEHRMNLHRLPLNVPVEANAENVFEEYFLLIHRELTTHLTQNEYMLEHLLDLMLYELSRLIQTEGSQIPEHIQRAENFIWKNLDHPLTLEDIAREASLSVPRFIPLFKQYYGEPPIQYLNRKRMDLAAQLLTYHPYTCKQVAELTGFNDPLHFSRRFKQFWGVSPREYRDSEKSRK